MAKNAGETGIFGTLISAVIIVLLLAGAITFLLSGPFEKAKKDILKAYHQPDTTIVIHNGVPDTVITIRK